MTNSVKRNLKGDIKFQVKLTEEQKQAKEKILNCKIAFLRGKAGSGKSMLAAQIALDLLFRKEVEKIILTRPAVNAGEEYGYLPGDKDAKLAPYTAAIYDNMYRLYSKDKIDSELIEGKIEVIPIGFMRGRNFSNTCVVIDESQNITQSQLELILTRLCAGSKMIFVGDSSQIDLKIKSQSGFDFISKTLMHLPGICSITLKENHRDPIVDEIINVLQQYS